MHGDDGRKVYTVAEFCTVFKISKGFYYKLQKSGRGPVAMKVGGRTLITTGAADRWCEKMESEAGAAA